VNSPGLVDSGYRGEMAIIMINTDKHEAFHIKRGDRIAQLVIQRVEEAIPIRVDELGDSSRGAGGFGSTGKDAIRE
jgi:dUTP pyrophosphatase